MMRETVTFGRNAEAVMIPSGAEFIPSAARDLVVVAERTRSLAALGIN